jgi:hypothetical protein
VRLLFGVFLVVSGLFVLGRLFLMVGGLVLVLSGLFVVGRLFLVVALFLEIDLGGRLLRGLFIGLFSRCGTFVRPAQRADRGEGHAPAEDEYKGETEDGELSFPDHRLLLLHIVVDDYY